MSAEITHPTTTLSDHSRKRQWGYQIVRVLLGLMLLAAAGLKGYQLLVEPMLQRTVWQVVQIQLEWLLGLWLLSSLYRRASRLVALVVFTAFGIYSAYRIVRGEASCECFGAIDVAPAYTLLLDAAVVLALIIFRPAAQVSISVMRRRLLISITVLIAFAVGVPTGYLMVRPGFKHIGSVPVAAIMIPTDRPATKDIAQVPASVQPQIPVQLTRDLGVIDPGSVHELTFPVPNPTDTDVQIRKTSIECRCTEINDWPNVLFAGQITDLPVTFTAPDKSAQYAKRIILFTHDLATPKINLLVTARIGLYLQVEPEVFDLGTIRIGENRRAHVTVVNHGKKPVRLLYSTSNVPGCIALVPKSPVAPGDKLNVPITVVADGTQKGSRNVTVRIHTDSPSQRTLDAVVRFRVMEEGPASSDSHAE